MQIRCPSCGTQYEVAEDAIGPQGRKVRCRTCGASWIETPAAVERPLPLPIAPVIASERAVPAVKIATPVTAEPEIIAAAKTATVERPPSPSRRRWPRAPLIALMLVVIVIGLGLAIASLVWGPQQIASEFGLGARRVPLGIAITKEPDWREIAGGSELFAVSGRIWNETKQVQQVPDVHAEIKDKAGKTIREWTIARPARELAPGAHVDFDGAAIDVPRQSATVALSFVGERDR